MSLLQNSNAISEGGYGILNSLRFQSASSQYLSRTPASVGNRKTWTWSGWVKRGLLTQGVIFSAGSGTENTLIFFNSTTQQLQFNCVTASTNRIVAQTAAVFRDPSAWYHIVYAVDTTQATSSNGIKVYVNGIQQTLTISPYTQNVDTAVNNTVAQQHGALSGYAAEYFDGYLSEVNFIDGQAITPSSFGETDTTTGQWVAKKYTGTYGTNGFYLPFSNGTSTTTLGYDSSGNSNNWTLNNFTRSAGISDCWMFDVPSGNGSSGTQPNSNYAVLNPLSKGANVNITNSNLNFAYTSGAVSPMTYSTVGMSSGKWYCEITVLGNDTMLGISNNQNATTDIYVGYSANSWGYYQTGNKYNSGIATAYGASYTTNDVIGIAFDGDAGTLTFYKNGTSQGVAFSSFPANTYYFCSGNGSTGNTGAFNFGQRAFVYTPPSGFKALCAANLPAATIKKGNTVFDAVLWTGNGTTGAGSVTGLNFQPDIVWAKMRSSAISHAVYNSIVGGGANKALSTNSTDSESSFNANATNGYLSTFDSNGFSYVGGTSPAYFSSNGNTYVGWAWDAGSSTVTNTNGTISSQVRANPTAGVSVVTYTGTGANATVGHGLGVAPKMIIVKSRSISPSSWVVWHTTLLGTQYLNLETTGATSTLAAVWNSTTPTSSVFNVGTNSYTNGNGSTFVAYCFSEIAGFSKFGSYTGNGSTDGVFIYTGFRPKYVMIKCTSNGGANFTWAIYDSARNEFNVMGQLLQANLSNAEAGAGTAIDFLSNGFKLRAANDGTNAVSQNYIYMAFAESPFQNSNSR